jgi:hypothetical protein
MRQWQDRDKRRETAMTKVWMALILVFTVLFPGAAVATCTCIYTGGTVREGETACIWTAKGNALARCEKVLNNTSWKLLGKACPADLSNVHDPTPVPSLQSG